ncbi:diphosphoinositol polyphosphate phosphohydrolase 1 isoform X3 [Oncorhynchus mykiss]|uniref:diphosphoinositol polyphosphate phosphohydrolase 1 isoform X3 n=2 Tax=Oncorhynchus mykiss TaxID=8022 RepID=UPI0018788CAD|nr:diphosphoinositol polyphosphate phosphohydrolase 1 isoform X3 [Oncorhynchus mykiss]
MAFQGSLQFFGPLLWNILDLSTRQLASQQLASSVKMQLAITKDLYTNLVGYAGVKGTLGRLVGIFENRERKHRTYVYILIVTEVLEDWEDSVNIGRKRDWFKIDDAIQVLQCHKPVQATYFEPLKDGCLTSNGTPLVATIGGDLSPTYNISQSSVSGIR